VIAAAERFLARAALALAAAGCVVYEPVPVPTRDPFEQSWGASIEALRDTGVAIQSADRGTGVITGSRPPFDVRVRVATRADGRIGVEINAKGPSGEDPALAQRIAEAYNRRMGR